LYIDTQEDLSAFVKACSSASLITIDTEFLREKTYYPQLCLLQIATEDYEAVIDPLAALDLTVLTPLLIDEKIMKIFHAGDQDRAILYNVLNTPVRPVFDTQKAALLLGLPQQISLATLVSHFCGVALKKESSFSDWSQRPLTAEQLSYAYEDVRYLPEIYTKMREKLLESKRLAWLEEDFKLMEEESIYKLDVRLLWKKLRGASALKGRKLAIAREITAWREETAQHRNLPRKWVITDEHIVEIAKREPQSIEALFRVRGLKERLGQRWAQEVLEAIRKGQSIPESEWPERDRPPFNKMVCLAKLDMLTALLHLRSKELRIASTFLTNHDELECLASGQRKGLPLLKGWRRELIGDELLMLLDGKLSLSLSGDDLKVTFAEQADDSLSC
jgi:ribonuclease D